MTTAHRMPTPSSSYYGALQTNARSAQDDEFSDLIDYSAAPTLLEDPSLKSIYRLRLLGLNDRDFPFYDVSYCWGVLQDGTHVRVQLPVHRFPKGRTKWNALIQWARDHDVYLARLGLFRDGTVSMA